MSNGVRETGFASENGNHMQPLHNISSVTISNEMFEKLYLNPANKVKGDLRRTFANPTPL